MLRSFGGGLRECYTVFINHCLVWLHMLYIAIEGFCAKRAYITFWADFHIFRIEQFTLHQNPPSKDALQKMPLVFLLTLFIETKCKSATTKNTQRCLSCQNKSLCQKIAQSCKKWKLAQKAMYALFAWNPLITLTFFLLKLITFTWFFRETNESNLLLKEKAESLQNKLQRADQRITELTRVEIENEVCD